MLDIINARRFKDNFKDFLACFPGIITPIPSNHIKTFYFNFPISGYRVIILYLFQIIQFNAGILFLFYQKQSFENAVNIKNQISVLFTNLILDRFCN